MTETERIFATAATADQVDAGVGIVWWAAHPPGDFALRVLDYRLSNVSDVNADWIGSLFARCRELVAEHSPVTYGCFVRVEHPGLSNVLKRADAAFCDTKEWRAINRAEIDIRPLAEHERAKWPATLDERADAIRPLVNSGRVIKLDTGLRRFSFRAIRTNHLVAQIKRHRPGDAASAGELLHAFVLGVLLGTTPRPMCYFDCFPPPVSKSSPSSGPFGGGYIPGRSPL